jgi:hypothetical protein
MADTPSFAKLVPGFEFLQGLVKNAGAALPNMGQWIAPTLDPAELDKRIDELRTVQFWLEQNARMLATTIQALEVQRMTLSTLQTMNVQMTDLRDAMKLAPVASMTSAAGAAASSVAQSFGAEGLLNAAKGAMVGGARKPADDAVGRATVTPAEAEPPAPAAKAAKPAKAAKAPEPPAAASVVDPMQWWGALTKQFTQIAADAMKDTAADAAKNFAGAMMKQGVDAAGEALKKAVGVPAGVATKAMSAASQAASAAGAAAAEKKATARKKTPVKAAAAGGARPAARKRGAAGGAKAPARSAKAGAH